MNHLMCDAGAGMSWEMRGITRGVAGKSFAGRQEVVALENYWIACKDLPMVLDSMINSTMAT